MQKTALIIIDVDFSLESMLDAKVMAVLDVANRSERIGSPYLDEEGLRQFAGGTANHGSAILTKLRRLLPDAPYVLIRIAGDDQRILRTQWHDGTIAAPGWTEMYLRAVAICQERGYSTVANASFGGFIHAMDGTGWEAHQLAKVTGPGKPGHVFVAASGNGEGEAEHASWTLAGNSDVWVHVHQPQPVHFNLWARGSAGWLLEVRRDGKLVQVINGADIPPNLWNGHQQVNFFVGDDADNTSFKVVRTESGARTHFDCWVLSGEGRFLNHIDAELVVEPAVFPHVIAVGLFDKQYSPGQKQPGTKPDLLLNGEDMVSFRVPEVVAAAAEVLENHPDMDVNAVLGELITRFGGKVW